MTEQLPFNTSPMPLKLRVEDYLALDEAGAFADYGKTELIEGEIFFMNAQHRPHGFVKIRLYDALRDALRDLGSALHPMVEVSIAVPPHNVPEPDLLLTSEPRGQGLVPLASVALVIEVADTTVPNDLGRKATLYARHRIPEYWVADVNARVIHQLWTPQGEVYTERREVAFGEPITSAIVPHLKIGTDEL